MATHLFAQTTALWLFDEPVGLYPSSVLDDSGPNDYPMVLGPGGKIVEGKYGNALAPVEQPSIEYPEGNIKFGLQQPPVAAGRSTAPLTWMNAKFATLMTNGETHLRKQVGFPNVTETRLNLGAFDWTVEFWFKPEGQTNSNGVVFEMGQGPRGENENITRLALLASGEEFILINQPGGIALSIPSDPEALNPEAGNWHHYAFVYHASQQQLRHYVDGKVQSLPQKCAIKALEPGEEAYFSVGRDGLWQNPLAGRIDELRFSSNAIYDKEFSPPESFAPNYLDVKLRPGPPLLFSAPSKDRNVIELGNRKHLFIDDAFIAQSKDIAFVVNPPRPAECVIDSIQGPFRKHVSVIEDENGLIRLYYGGPDDHLAVLISKDGLHWEAPNLASKEYKGARNIVIPEPTAMGNVFIDPNAPPEARWKYVTGFHDRGIYVFYSSDGWSFKRVKTAALPFRSGSQSNLFYDDQRQLYVGYHRSDFATTPAGETQREFGMSEVENIMDPWPFQPISQQVTWRLAEKKRLHDSQPWYLDNGPLTPGGLGLELPTVFAPDDSLDPVGTDIYVPKAIKYPWAPDAYLAFPLMYFHYESDGPRTRQILMQPERLRGSGPIEAQLSVSRDGIHWRRYPRPTYIGIGKHGDHDIHQVYMAHGLVKCGDEIWQYYFGESRYHSSWLKEGYVRAIYRVVQRLDGFVSVDAPYDREGWLTTRPFRFHGNRLIINIDTDATGYAQVGFFDENGQPIPGFSVDDCIYINGDFIETEVEFWEKGKDLSPLMGKTVQLIFRMRGSKLYALQFEKR